MNKKIIITIVVLIVILCLLVGGLLTATHKSPTTDTGTATGQVSGTFPSSPVTDTGTTTSTNQDSIVHNPNVHADGYNPGYYYIGNVSSDDPASNPPYTIRYIAATKYFNVAILQEPIGENRQAAETYLMQQLGLSEQQMCSLNYAVYVPNDVNTQYSGENLGFSFCPGAVPLPQ